LEYRKGMYGYEALVGSRLRLAPQSQTAVDIYS
jgi:hypothetical protein